MAPPKISVLIATYGHARFIGQTLDSIFQQDRLPDEVIVVNDGSPDDTASAVQPYLKKIKYVEQENQGVVQACNHCLELCTGDYVLMIDSDDWLKPDFISTMAEVLDCDPEVGVVYAGVTLVDEMGVAQFDNCPPQRLTGKHKNVLELIKRNYVHAAATLCRKKALDDAGPFPPFPLCLDWAMWLNIIFRGWHFYGIGTPMSYYRRHSTNMDDPVRTLDALQNQIDTLNYMRAYHRSLSQAEETAIEHSIQAKLLRRRWASVKNKYPRFASAYNKFIFKHPMIAVFPRYILDVAAKGKKLLMQSWKYCAIALSSVLT